MLERQLVVLVAAVEMDVAVEQAGQEGLARAVHPLVAVQVDPDGSDPAFLDHEVALRERRPGAIQDLPAVEQRPGHPSSRLDLLRRRPGSYTPARTLPRGATGGPPALARRPGPRAHGAGLLRPGAGTARGRVRGTRRSHAILARRGETCGPGLELPRDQPRAGGRWTRLRRLPGDADRGAVGTGDGSALGHPVATLDPLAAGTEEQKDRFLGPACRGERRDAYEITEEGAGSDVSMVTTTARRDGEAWILNGEKWHVTSGDVADFFLVDAHVDGDPAKATVFLVDKLLPASAWFAPRSTCTPSCSSTRSTRSTTCAWVRTASWAVSDRGSSSRRTGSWRSV